ncbi:MAG: hypothetical protein R2687_05975 [Candidatus Nanopelagicales bacterium]
MGPDGPRFGDYVGLTPVLRPRGRGLPGQRQITGFLRHKRWMYTFAANEEILVTAAIVDAGPTGTTFITVADRRTGHFLADISRPGGPGRWSVSMSTPERDTAVATACPGRTCR